ncbi:hypothetical protein CHCC20372_3104 [Bacillus paralicheniformis]|nr:hypothetical protein CHCC20372_3104 [Bacillus paralicheniformis]
MNNLISYFLGSLQIRESASPILPNKKAATNQLHNIRVQKINVRRLSFLDSGIRSFLLSLSYDKME